MKKVQLEVRDSEGKFVRSYSFFFDETEGTNYSLTLDKQTYPIDAEGNIIGEVNHKPNPKFTPYD